MRELGTQFTQKTACFVPLYKLSQRKRLKLSITKESNVAWGVLPCFYLMTWRHIHQDSRIHDKRIDITFYNIVWTPFFWDDAVSLVNWFPTFRGNVMVSFHGCNIRF